MQELSSRMTHVLTSIRDQAPPIGRRRAEWGRSRRGASGRVRVGWFFGGRLPSEINDGVDAADEVCGGSCGRVRPADLDGDNRGEELAPRDDDIGADSDEAAGSFPRLRRLDLDADFGDDLLASLDWHVGLGEVVDGVAVHRHLTEEVEVTGGGHERP